MYSSSNFYKIRNVKFLWDDLTDSKIVTKSRIINLQTLYAYVKSDIQNQTSTNIITYT